MEYKIKVQYKRGGNEVLTKDSGRSPGAQRRKTPSLWETPGRGSGRRLRNGRTGDAAERGASADEPPEGTTAKLRE